MKTKRIIACLSAIPLLLGCSERDIQQDGAEKVRIDIRGEVVQEYVTRANDGGFADGDQIGVFVVDRVGGSAADLQLTGNHADNVRYTYDAESGLWSATYDLYWTDNQTSVDAYSYYPFDGSLASVDAYPFTIQTKQNQTAEGVTLTGYEASDMLWAKAENVSPGNFINLKHRHIMAGVEVTLLEGEDFEDGEWDGLDKSVLVENTRVNTLVDLSTGGVSLSGDAVSSIIPQQRGASFRAVVAPQTVGAGLKLLTITVGGISYQFTRDDDMLFAAGKLHKFTIKVDKRVPKGDYLFTLVSEAVTAWENDPESHNGSAREYTIVQVNEGDYIGDVIEGMGLDPAKIVNLKVSGVFGPSLSQHEWGDSRYNADDNFGYIREKMTALEALNMKELRTKQATSFYWEGGSSPTDGWGLPPYNQPIIADDYISKGAFNEMTRLSYVVWPDSLKGIGDEAFNKTQLRGSIILPEGVKHIGGAFGGNRLLTGDLYIPSTVEYIGDGAFAYCNFTNELILPQHMVYLGENAFRDCKYMTGTISIPDGLDEVNASWLGMEGINGMAVIPQGVKKVNGIGCPIVSLIIPEGVTEIGRLNDYSWQPFQAYEDYRKKLRSVSLPTTLRKMGEQAFAGSGISHIKMFDGIEIIPKLAFAFCESLQDTVTLPSTVTKIEEQAFYHCTMLNAVVIPADVGIIEALAFANCVSLDYIECQGSEPPAIEENTFSGVEKNNFTLVVPEGAVETYKNAPHWSEFKRISTYRNFVCRPMQAKLLNKGHVRDIVLNADEAWSVISCPDWITLSQTSGYKKTELKATISDLAAGSDNREGSVVFQLQRNDEGGNPITCEFKVKQFDYGYAEDATVTLQKSSKGNGGINILFVGDGYDAEDIADGTYLNHVNQEMEYLFAVEPYKTYRDYFNVSAAIAMSDESGVVDSPDKWRNTKFSISYGTSCSQRLEVPFDDIISYVFQDVSDNPVTVDNSGNAMVICVPNSDAYEGLTLVYGNGFSVAVCPHSTWDYPYDARGIVQHEAGGHGWGRLDDEYIYHRCYIQKCPCFCCSHDEAILANHADNFGLNLSLNGKYSTVPWSHLITDSRYSDICDIYEGGHMHAQGIFRSELNSCMNNNVPYFSTWSRQLIVERTLKAAGVTFDFETFVSMDSREMGDKFLTRATYEKPWQQVKAVHSEHHGTLLRKGSPMDYLKKKGGKR